MQSLADFPTLHDFMGADRNQMGDLVHGSFGGAIAEFCSAESPDYRRRLFEKLHGADEAGMIPKEIDWSDGRLVRFWEDRVLTQEEFAVAVAAIGRSGASPVTEPGYQDPPPAFASRVVRRLPAGVLPAARVEGVGGAAGGPALHHHRRAAHALELGLSSISSGLTDALGRQGAFHGQEGACSAGRWRGSCATWAGVPVDRSARTNVVDA